MAKCASFWSADERFTKADCSNLAVNRLASSSFFCGGANMGDPLGDTRCDATSIKPNQRCSQTKCSLPHDVPDQPARLHLARKWCCRMRRAGISRAHDMIVASVAATSPISRQFKYYREETGRWCFTDSLYRQATPKIRYVGQVALSKRHHYRFHLYLVRAYKPRIGGPPLRGPIRVNDTLYRRLHRAPWLLAISPDFEEIWLFWKHDLNDFDHLAASKGPKA